MSTTLGRWSAYDYAVLMGKCRTAVWDVNISTGGIAGTFCSSRGRSQQQTQCPSKRKHVTQTLSSNEICQEWHVCEGPVLSEGLLSASKQDCSISPPPSGIRGFPLKTRHMAHVTCVCVSLLPFALAHMDRWISFRPSQGCNVTCCPEQPPPVCPD